MKKRQLLKSGAALLLSAMLLAGCGSGEDKGSSTGTSDTVTVTVTEEAKDTPTEAPTAEPTKAEEPEPVVDSDLYDAHGALSVSGTDLVDSKGEKFQLRGMSTHGIAWFPGYINEDTFTFLRDGWNTNCIRIAMYTDENMGYCNNGDQDYLKKLVKKAVDTATSLNMYVIVDWHILHDQTPLKYKDEALAFFEEISKTYASNDNVLYEICNEPNGKATWDDVKAYAEEVIPVIRANDPNCIVIVGSPTWSQDIDKAAADPLDFENVMYTLHFYAATHKEWLRERAEKCIKGGLPVFISEFGICDASGNGKIDYEQAEEWKKLIEEYNLSYMCWNLSNNNESSAILKKECDKMKDWQESDLNEQGVWISEWFKSE